MLSRSVYRSSIILLISALLAGCAGSSKALIAEKDQELAQLREELKQLEQRLNTEKKVVDKLTKAQDQVAVELSEEQQRSMNYQAELGRLKKEASNKYVLGNRIVLTNSLVFTAGSPDLSSQGKQAMAEIWETLAKYPDRSVLIEGHTDSTPIGKGYRWKYASNWELSAARALSVLHYFEDQGKVRPGQLSAVAYGEHHPLASNQTAEGRAQNRRVEIVVGEARK